MVECESENIQSGAVIDSVLIDTWWNVNISALVRLNCDCDVLIDTWWNVNMQTIESMFVNDCVLIDTWWNVN